ncbi:hypothetical protein D9757_004265 [Collybiopsis confluens]|uniref:Cell cycle checkpoint control protein RAD9A n=1 Tax=Collybiopsis confluens TaxID=2823264 RepID=A0A8H5MCG7_9AGAR|nr:hypothetical protein D9757_004265 [Collybiopsis confluens]
MVTRAASRLVPELPPRPTLMQASFDAHSLKPFTRALSCLSRYGEELSIYATAETLSLFCTNSSKSAYCRFKFNSDFFSRYRVGDPAKGIHDTFVGQLMAKSLLSILKHKTIESTLERCEISTVEADSTHNADADDEKRDGLESKLIVRLHCKHGVIKTHKLLLLGSTTLMAPGIPDPSHESLLTIGPRAIREMIEQFSLPKGVKSDPQLVWTFSETNVEVRSLGSSIDSKSEYQPFRLLIWYPLHISTGTAQLATELSISAEEFDVYNLYETPTTITFHLREFNATIAFAELSGLGLDIRFTDPAEPLFIDVEGESFETLFVISTSQPPGMYVRTQQRNGRLASSGPLKKRLREDTPAGESRFKKPTKAVQPTTDRADVTRDTNSPARSALSSRQSMPPPATPGIRASQRHATPISSGLAVDSTSSLPPTPEQPDLETALAPQQPLFLPGSSQLSILDEEELKESGLGIEHMTVDEFDEMMEGMEEEEDELSARGNDSLAADEPVLGATQHPGATLDDDLIRTFHPLFED